MKIIMVLLSAFFINCSNKTQPVTSNKDFACTLTCKRKVYKIGEVPHFEVRIINKTNKEVYLVGSLDGSDMQWRLPYCYFTIDKPMTDVITSLRCGNTNPLRLQDFKLVKPGEAFDPYQQIDNQGFFGDYSITEQKTFRNTGNYKIQFHYSTIPNSKEKRGFGESFHNADSTEIKSLLEKVPAIDISSNTVEIKMED